MRNLALCTALMALTACPADDPNTTDSPTSDPTTDGTASTDGTATTDGTDATSTTDEPTSTTDTPTSTTDEPTSTTDPGTTTESACDGLDIPAIDESGCEPLATDYQPRTNNSADDEWPACVSDTGPYTLVDNPPSTIARIVAYENIADLLWRKADPTPADFTAARSEYVLPEGLESRLVRREDLHFPPIPEAEWDPQVDADKQCTVEALATKYAERCVGPAAMKPLVDEAFAAGQAGEGDAKIHAARIHGGLLWFLYLSVYKEANTCATVAPKDCDSAWAYYTGGEAIDAPIGMAAEVDAISGNAHERIHDGILATRCWRDIAQDGGMYPLLETLPDDQQELFAQGWEQLDQGLHRGYAVIVRDHMQQYVDASCSSADTQAHWAFLQVAGPVLNREAQDRNPAEAGKLAALWTTDAPGPDEVTDAIFALDAIFPCP
ncbi:hypothetical protein [Nannocystis bainbridge]|uniref:Uncharacterized protein n=1 Tax=Nannocystis bainbridge TaxID=2995303 RepID=A0ABT5DZS3_9BACT|nr:hypothetical protein [Nannocystis bainbridge]MDC0718670.1 hypothetical protein [Nannocystis bainbridge]